MPTETIAHVIQLSIAPVFLLTGVSAMLGVLSNRLSRIIDRGRLLEDRVRDAEPARVIGIHTELGILSRRARLVNRAIAMCTVCALLVCAVIISLFLAAFFDADASRPIGLIFIGAMISLSGGLVAFLREILLATRSLRIGPQ